MPGRQKCTVSSTCQDRVAPSSRLRSLSGCPRLNAAVESTAGRRGDRDLGPPVPEILPAACDRLPAVVRPAAVPDAGAVRSQLDCVPPTGRPERIVPGAENHSRGGVFLVAVQPDAGNSGGGPLTAAAARLGRFISPSSTGRGGVALLNAVRMPSRIIMARWLSWRSRSTSCRRRSSSRSSPDCACGGPQPGAAKAAEPAAVDAGWAAGAVPAWWRGSAKTGAAQEGGPGTLQACVYPP